MGFKTELNVCLVGEQRFKLLDDLEYENKDYVFKVKKGFVFDGASIPRLLWTTIGCPFGGLYTKPACLHDILYATHLFGKEESDSIFLEAMVSCEVEEDIRKTLYDGVRLFGNKSYEEKENISESREFLEIESKGRLW